MFYSYSYMWMEPCQCVCVCDPGANYQLDAENGDNLWMNFPMKNLIFHIYVRLAHGKWHQRVITLPESTTSSHRGLSLRTTRWFGVLSQVVFGPNNWGDILKCSVALPVCSNLCLSTQSGVFCFANENRSMAHGGRKVCLGRWSCWSGSAHLQRAF